MLAITYAMMRWFVILGVLVGAYYYFLMHTTDMVLAQTQQLQQKYSYIADHADEFVSSPANR